MKRIIFLLIMTVNIALIGQNILPLQEMQYNGEISISQSTTISGYNAINAIDGDITTFSQTGFGIGIDSGFDFDDKGDGDKGNGNKGGAGDKRDYKPKREDTCKNNTPWLEVDLGGCVIINGVMIESDSLKDYYIFISEFPFNCDKIEPLLADEGVSYFHVTEPLSEPLLMQGLPPTRYLRIQGDNYDIPIKINELGLLAGPSIIDCGGWTDIEKYGEDCHDGIDNDGDGKIDCEDYPCEVNEFLVHLTNPSCPMCNDGSICITTNLKTNLFSIDGGITFYKSQYGNKCFENLSVGEYDVVVKTKYGCTKSKEIEIRSPPGDPTSYCPNGDFEDGNFTGWTGGVATIRNGSYNFTNTAFWHHNVINTNNAPYWLFSSRISDLGTYVAKMGFSAGNWDVERLTYCFTVDKHNKDFYFNYAFDMATHDTEIGHTDGLPFFQWRIYNEKEPSRNIEYNKIESNDKSLFQASSHSYKSWICQYYNLNSYIGQDLCIEFIKGDCTYGDHGAIAYIDGICGNGIEPDPIITVDNNICKFNDEDYITISLKAEGGGGYTEYYWEYDIINEDGETYDHFITKRKIGSSSYETFSFKNNYIKCNSIIEVKFYAFNDCGSTIVSDEIHYNCNEYTVDYCSPLYYCGGQSVNRVQMMGDVNCEGCTYEWKSSSVNGGLDRYDVKFPIVNEAYHANAFDNYYIVNVTTPEGCVYENYIHLKPGPQVFISNSDIIPAECEFANGSSIVTVRLSNATSQLRDLYFIDQLTGDTYLLTYDEENSTENDWIFYYQFNRKVDLDLILDFSNYPEFAQYPYCYNEEESTCTFEDKIFLPALPYPTPFSEQWAIIRNANPVIIHPEGDNLFFLKNWNIILNNSGDPCPIEEFNEERSSIDYYRLKIWQTGSAISVYYDETISTDSYDGNGVDLRDLVWDYSNVPADSYTWQATIRTRCEFDTDWDSVCDIKPYETHTGTETVIKEQVIVVLD